MLFEVYRNVRQMLGECDCPIISRLFEADVTL